MAGTAVLTENTFKGFRGAIRVIKWDWVADTDGTVDAAENDKKAKYVNGTVIGCKNAPDEGANAVGETFTFTVVDTQNGMDVLQGLFDDVVASNDATVDLNFRVPVTVSEGAPIVLVNEELSLVLGATNAADNGGTGAIYVYVELP